jgi:N-carbamoylputrescine amidase
MGFMTGSSSPQFRIGLVQMRCQAEPESNLTSAIAGIRRAAEHGARLICLPELFLLPYFCQRQDPNLFDLAEPVPGPTTQRLAQIARQTGAVLAGSLFERRAPGIYHNTAFLLDTNGDLAGVYRKMHIPDDPLYFEKYYFTPGDLGFQAFDTHLGRIGLLVCWDQWFPEAARLTALRGAAILLYPTAIGWHPREKSEYGKEQYEAWELMHRAHAVANGVYVVAVNRVGHEGPSADGLEFWGGSVISDPFGKVLARAGHGTDEVLVADFDLTRIDQVRRNWPFLRDRRIDAYDSLTRRLID